MNNTLDLYSYNTQKNNDIYIYVIFIIVPYMIYYVYNYINTKINDLTNMINTLNNNNQITDVSNSLYDLDIRMIRLELFNRDQRIYNNLIVNKLIILDSILDLDNSVLTNEFTKIICEFLYDKRRKLLINYKIENNELFIVINKDNFNKLLKFSEDRKKIDENISKLKKLLIDSDEIKLDKDDNYIYSLLKFG